MDINKTKKKLVYVPIQGEAEPVSGKKSGDNNNNFEIIVEKIYSHNKAG